MLISYVSLTPPGDSWQWPKCISYQSQNCRKQARSDKYSWCFMALGGIWKAFQVVFWCEYVCWDVFSDTWWKVWYLTEQYQNKCPPHLRIPMTLNHLVAFRRISCHGRNYSQEGFVVMAEITPKLPANTRTQFSCYHHCSKYSPIGWKFSSNLLLAASKCHVTIRRQ